MSGFPSLVFTSLHAWMVRCGWVLMLCWRCLEKVTPGLMSTWAMCLRCWATLASTDWAGGTWDMVWIRWRAVSWSTELCQSFRNMFLASQLRISGNTHSWLVDTNHCWSLIGWQARTSWSESSGYEQWWWSGGRLHIRQWRGRAGQQSAPLSQCSVTCCHLITSHC